VPAATVVANRRAAPFSERDRRFRLAARRTTWSLATPKERGFTWIVR